MKCLLYARHYYSSTGNTVLQVRHYVSYSLGAYVKGRERGKKNPQNDVLRGGEEDYKGSAFALSPL